MSGGVVVLGALHHDIMVEAPSRPRTGETVAGTRWFPKCGGKGGNQAVAAARAGARVSFIGAVGADAFGDTLLAHLAASGVDAGHVERIAGTGSGMSVAILDPQGDYGAVIVSGANALIGPGALARAAPLLQGAAVLLLQNEVPEAVSLAAAAEARKGRARILLNAAPARTLSPGWTGRLDTLVVNAVEAEGLGAAPVRDLASAAAAAAALLSLAPSVIVTAGAAGAALAAQDGTRLALPAPSVAVASTHGAGDAFLGALAAALAAGADMAAALPRAIAAAARLVATPEAERGRPQGETP